MVKPLFEIEAKYRALMAKAEEMEGVLTPELEEELKITLEEKDQKLPAYRYRINEFEAANGSIDGEIEVHQKAIDALKARKNANVRRIDRLKDFLLVAIKTFGEENKAGNPIVKFPTFSLSIKTSKSLAFTTTEEDAIDRNQGASFIKTKTITSIDKAKVKELLESGEEIEGCSIKEKETVVIR